MKDITVYSQDAVQYPRTGRTDMTQFVTSGDAGKIIPVAYAPVLREDAVTGRANINVEMMETAEIILNPVHAVAHAYFVPYLAFDRFNSMDNLMRSYMGEKERDADAAPVDFIETNAYTDVKNDEVFVALGLHARPGTEANTAIVEAYNQVVNFRRKNRSKSLTARALTTTTLAEAFWNHKAMKHIVADYDPGIIDGQIPLGSLVGNLPVKVRDATAMQGAVTDVRASGGGDLGQKTGTMFVRDDAGDSQGDMYFQSPADLGQTAAALEDGGAWYANQIIAELTADGASFSLSDIDLAKKTQAFARMRERYEGHTEDWIINQLMSGMTIPELYLKDPIHIGMQEVPFRYVRRNATDAGNLDEGVTVGVASMSVPINLPRSVTGGVIMVTLEIVPEQMFERKKDYFFTGLAQGAGYEAFPMALRDHLDPDPISVITNEHVDIDHSTPDGVFGYAPMNHEWQRRQIRAGGKFYRPDVDGATDVERRRFWAAETQDPTLTTDFYLVTDLHKKVFVDPNVDGFDIMGNMDLMVNGNTQFGPDLVESEDTHYADTLAQVDQTRVDPDA